MEIGHRYALFYDQEFQAAVKEYLRRARQFVNGVILKCHDKYQETIAQELQTIHNLHEKHISQTQWAIAHEVGVQAT